MINLHMKQGYTNILADLITRDNVLDMFIPEPSLPLQASNIRSRLDETTQGEESTKGERKSTETTCKKGGLTSRRSYECSTKYKCI